MYPPKIKVIKNSRIMENGTLTLPSGPGIAVAVSSGGRTVSVPPSGPAQARIVESNSDYAIIEIQCGCGHKSFVQCNYGNVAAGV